MILRGGIEVEDPLDVTLQFLAAYPLQGDGQPVRPRSFDERDLAAANRGGARISALERQAILDRRPRIERALRAVLPESSLADADESIPWEALTRLFEAFGDIRGVGFSKVTKALHPKRPALIPILDSVVHDYLAGAEPALAAPAPFGERAVALVRGYKRDLDRNRGALGTIRRELSNRGYQLTEVRIFDLVVWSVQSGYSSLRQVRGSAGGSIGVRSSRKPK